MSAIRLRLAAVPLALLLCGGVSPAFAQNVQNKAGTGQGTQSVQPPDPGDTGARKTTGNGKVASTSMAPEPREGSPNKGPSTAPAPGPEQKGP